MSSAYPGGLDSLATNHVNADSSLTVHPTLHNDVNDAVNKIEAELGINPSGTFTDLVTRLLNLTPGIVRACVIRTTAQTISTSTGTAITWQSSAGTRCYNLNGLGGSLPWSSGTNPDRFTAPIDGGYAFSASFNYDDGPGGANGAGTGERDAEIEYNGVAGKLIATVNHDVDETDGRFLHIAVPYFRMSAGDFIRLMAFQDSGQNRTIAADGYDAANFSVCRANFTYMGP